MSDPIEILPTDKNPITNEESQIVDRFFQDNDTGIKKILREMKGSIVAGLLFLVFNLPPVDGLIKTLLPITAKSPYILAFIKAIVFIILFWIISNFYLSKK